MFGFRKKNKELDALLSGVLSNEANNYKDAAQDYLKKYEAKLQELQEAGSLNDRQKEYYSGQLSEMKSRMQKFTHKDQTPYWT